jgi:UDP-N-acetylglucosamine 2-epimerase (non-hydrolysing)
VKIKKLLIVMGTRPEVIKLAPVIKAVRETAAGTLKAEVLVTAQHREILDHTLDVFGIVPDYDLDLMTEGQSISAVCAGVLGGMEPILDRERPDAVVVQGDTTTTFAAALAACHGGVRVAHVEAGLRSWDRLNPFPEEVNRSLISRFSDFNFCPTGRARENLVKEGVDEKTIYVTGNTVVDALEEALKIPRELNPNILGDIDPDTDDMVLLTMHRRESFGEPMERVFGALKRLVEGSRNIKVVFPVHPNPSVVKAAEATLKGITGIRLVDPLPYLDFVNLMKLSKVIVSDSGGVCEEAPSLGKPVLLIREVTERPEAIEAGTAILVGTDPEKITAAVRRLTEDGAEYARFQNIENPFGDGNAAGRIVKTLVDAL